MVHCHPPGTIDILKMSLFFYNQLSPFLEYTLEQSYYNIEIFPAELYQDFPLVVLPMEIPASHPFPLLQLQYNHHSYYHNHLQMHRLNE